MAQVSTKRIYNIKSELTLDQKYKVTKQSSVSQKHASKTSALEKKHTADTKSVAKHVRCVSEEAPTVNVQSAKSFPYSLVIGALICTVMLLMLVLNFAKRYELTVNVSQNEKTLNILQEELADLNTEIDTAVTELSLGAYSNEYFGYVTKDQIGSRIISSDRGDTVTVLSGEEKGGGIGTVLSTLYDAIRNIFE